MPEEVAVMKANDDQIKVSLVIVQDYLISQQMHCSALYRHFNGTFLRAKLTEIMLNDCHDLAVERIPL